MNIRLLPELPQNCRAIYHFVTGHNVPVEIYTHDWDELQWIEITGEHGTFKISTLGGIEFFKNGNDLYIENYFSLIDFIRSLGYEAPRPAIKKSRFWPFFILFFFISCKAPGDFRDIELSIINADNSKVYLQELPGYKQIYSEVLDIEYNPEATLHISNIPDGKYFLKVFSKDTVRELTFDYTGRKSISIEF